jgi:hypothetical protein
MEMTDRFDLPVTSASAAAIGDYVAAVDLLLSANTGAGELLERTLAVDPDFALAHVARARLLQVQARMPEARTAAERAMELRAGVSAREQQHIDTISRAVEGSATEALALVYTHVGQYPRDALPLSLGPGTAASRRAMLRRHCAPAPLPSPAVQTPRPRGCSKRRSPTCPGLAEVTRNARSSRTR